MEKINASSQPQPSGNAHHLADDIRVGILADSSYAEGMRAGYSMGTFGDEARYQKSLARLHAQICEARAELKDQPSGNADVGIPISGNLGHPDADGLPPLPNGYVIQMTPDPDSTPAEWFDETDMRNYARAALAALASGQDRGDPDWDADDQREFKSIGKAVNRAAADLPEGLDIRIDIENGSGTVYWRNRAIASPGRLWHMIEMSGEPFSNHINAAIEAARAAAKTDPHD
ncbi:hypothetical protein [Aquamicrobium sp.]|uniref:hypothetical protein n=1 Tax=Aquamicrobium sp. TaxID=1872579 RepID=UPI002584D11D|nr:hypothetical protein [Aquamicrobium sp.]MCK9553494.1 hypothetical protein [Aquamicrobium sp.]